MYLCWNPPCRFASSSTWLQQGTCDLPIFIAEVSFQEPNCWCVTVVILLPNLNPCTVDGKPLKTTIDVLLVWSSKYGQFNDPCVWTCWEDFSKSTWTILFIGSHPQPSNFTSFTNITHLIVHHPPTPASIDTALNGYPWSPMVPRTKKNLEIF